jgi:hypothetical protein
VTVQDLKMCEDCSHHLLIPSSVPSLPHLTSPHLPNQTTTQVRRKHHHPSSEREAAFDLDHTREPSRSSISCREIKDPPIRLTDDERTPGARHRTMGSGKVSTGSAAGASSRPHQAPGSSVCCMCGDRGLLPDLFRCSAYSFRSQHTYVHHPFSSLQIQFLLIRFVPIFGRFLNRFAHPSASIPVRA